MLDADLVALMVALTVDTKELWMVAMRVGQKVYHEVASTALMKVLKMDY